MPSAVRVIDGTVSPGRSKTTRATGSGRGELADPHLLDVAAADLHGGGRAAVDHPAQVDHETFGVLQAGRSNRPSSPSPTTWIWVPVASADRTCTDQQLAGGHPGRRRADLQASAVP